MGFLDSYKRLSKKQKIALGLVGIVIGLYGPTVIEKANDYYQTERNRPKVRMKNIYNFEVEEEEKKT